MPCPVCGQWIGDSWPRVIWHVLNRWHNPFTVYRRATVAGLISSFWLGVVIAFSAGAGVLAAIWVVWLWRR
jgi:hypothetical protein